MSKTIFGTKDVEIVLVIKKYKDKVSFISI